MPLAPATSTQLTNHIPRPVRNTLFEVHAHEVHAHEIHTHELYVYEMHAHKAHCATDYATRHLVQLFISLLAPNQDPKCERSSSFSGTQAIVVMHQLDAAPDSAWQAGRM